MAESSHPDETTELLAETKLGSKSYKEDVPETWTFARRIAHSLSRFSWYSPFQRQTNGHQRRGFADDEDNDDEGTNRLQDAWAYFEHVVLPRHFLREESQESTRDDEPLFEKAKPGESRLPTRLYGVWETKEQDLADMGVSIGLYFSTLRAFSWIFLLAGILNLPIMLYYASGKYNNDEEGGLDWILRSSAICTDQRWRPCPSCRWHDWDYFPRKFDRYAQSLSYDHHVYEESLNFIKINRCRFGYSLGWFTFVSVIVVAVALYLFSFEILKRNEIKFDESAQTSSDYSIRVENPPPEANDADEWRAFFSQFGASQEENSEDTNGANDHVVTCCTVTLDNEVLVRALVERRQLLIQLESLLKPGANFNKYDLDHAVENAMEDDSSWWQKLFFGTGKATEIRDKIRALDEEISDLSNLQKQKYVVSEVFITFETEQAQRKALEALALSTLAPIMAMMGRSVLPDHLLFRGEHLLKVTEAPEPTAVRWGELDATLPIQVAQRLGTSALTLLCIIASMLLITYTRDNHGATMAALVISILNTCVPYICKGITSYESHTQEGTKSTSRYIKITIFMFFNTAIVTSIITPFTDSLSNDEGAITKSIYAIFVFELIRGPIMQLSDPTGFIYRHIMGPRTKNFRRMLLLFTGTPYELSERYTDMTNVIFLTFYYATIFPAGFFFAAVTLIVHYWTDKFCLLRVWAQAPEEGTRISVFCRTFIMLSLVIYVVMTSYSISAFPYDNACVDDSPLPEEYIGDHTVYDFDNQEYHIHISPGALVYQFCNQDFMRYRPFPVFPPLPSKQPEGKEWMTAEQENIAKVFGWTSVGAIVFVLLVFLKRLVLPFLQGLFRSSYKPTGKASSLGFSEVKEIFAYVPQVKLAGHAFPLLVCDVSNLDPELLGWNDPYLGNDAHNLILDIPGLAEKPIFSKVHHWPKGRTQTESIAEEEIEQPRESLLGHLGHFFPFLN